VAPREIDFAKSLPRTRSGKIMRRLLKARELGLPEGDTSTLEAAPDTGELAEAASQHLGIDADHTGTAGLAGLIQLTRDGVVRPDETVAVIFSGARRDADAAHPQ